MKLINLKNKKKGFTLIELMVVISIVLILSGLIVPKVLGYQDKARKAKVVNTASQIFNASMENYSEKEGVFTSGADLQTAIASLTDAAVDSVTLDGKVAGDAIIKFQSDSKPYNIKLSAGNNSYSVFNGDDTTGEIYKNK